MAANRPPIHTTAPRSQAGRRPGPRRSMSNRSVALPAGVRLRAVPNRRATLRSVHRRSPAARPHTTPRAPSEPKACARASVASLDRRSEAGGGVELEAWDLCVERRVVVAHEVVVALHVATRRLEDHEALVFVHLAGRDDRLLADDAFPLDLAVLADRIVNAPSPRQQLRRHRPDVLDAHIVREDVVPRVRTRLLGEIRWPHGDANAVRFSIEER